MTLPRFQEPDWSSLPKEAVAWAVDESGWAYIYAREPRCDITEWVQVGVIANVGRFDLTDIDWCTTLRTRPKTDLQAAQESPEFKAQIEALAESVDDLKESQRNYELERLAEEAWKAILGNSYVTGPHEGLAKEAFLHARAFINEREKRRGK